MCEEQSQITTRGRLILGSAWLYDWLEPLVMFGAAGRLTRRIVEALDPQSGERILDVGCGTGVLTSAAARRRSAVTVVGIDAAAPMLRVAVRKRAGPACCFQAAAAEELPFDGATFDAAISAMFFHHVDLDLKRRSAREIVRVLKPGGRVVIADLDRPWTIFGTCYAWGGAILFRQAEIRENIAGRIPEVLAAAGLRDLRVTHSALGCIRVWAGHKATD